MAGTSGWLAASADPGAATGIASVILALTLYVGGLAVLRRRLLVEAARVLRRGIRASVEDRGRRASPVTDPAGSTPV
jgi:hypothetical protein